MFLRQELPTEDSLHLTQCVWVYAFNFTICALAFCTKTSMATFSTMTQIIILQGQRVL